MGAPCKRRRRPRSREGEGARSKGARTARALSRVDDRPLERTVLLVERERESHAAMWGLRLGRRGWRDVCADGRQCRHHSTLQNALQVGPNSLTLTSGSLQTGSKSRGTPQGEIWMGDEIHPCRYETCDEIAVTRREQGEILENEPCICGLTHQRHLPRGLAEPDLVSQCRSAPLATLPTTPAPPLAWAPARASRVHPPMASSFACHHCASSLLSLTTLCPSHARATQIYTHLQS